MESKQEKKLQYILDLVIQWLKFAEAKNGTLVALVGASLIGITRILSVSNFNVLIEIYLYIYLLFGSMSLLISLISFIPKIKIPAFIKKKDTKETKNLYFYGHLKNYNIQSLLTNLFPNKDKFNRNHHNLAQQVIINSKITYNKYELFKVALILLIMGLITPVLFLPAILIFQDFFKELF